MKRNDYYIELNLFSQKYLLPNELINYHRVRGTFSRLRIYAGLQIRAQHWGGWSAYFGDFSDIGGGGGGWF